MQQKNRVQPQYSPNNSIELKKGELKRKELETKELIKTGTEWFTSILFKKTQEYIRDRWKCMERSLPRCLYAGWMGVGLLIMLAFYGFFLSWNSENLKTPGFILPLFLAGLAISFEVFTLLAFVKYIKDEKPEGRFLFLFILLQYVYIIASFFSFILLSCYNLKYSEFLILGAIATI